MANTCVLKEFVEGCRISMKIVYEEGAERSCKIVQTARTGLEQLNGGQQAGTVLNRRFHSRRLPFFRNEGKQAFGGIGTNVLGVEPVELSAIENGVGS